MKNALVLIASAALLFTACSKDSSDPVVPTPVVGDGTGKFTFRMDAADYQVDTLIVSYLGRDGKTNSQTILGQNTWNSPDLIFKTGDSIRADVKAMGSVKKTLPGTSAELSFEIYPSTIAVPSVKRTNNTASMPVINKRFNFSGSKFNTY